MWNMSATNFCWYLFLFLDLIGLICGNFWSSQMDREYYPAQHHHQHHHHDTHGLLSSIIADSDRHPKDYVEHHYVIDGEPKENGFAQKSSQYSSNQPSMLMLSTLPSLLLTVLTFPLTLSLLFHIVRQLVMIQNVFSQTLAAPSKAMSRENQLKVDEALSKLDRSLQKFDQIEIQLNRLSQAQAKTK
ncbi:hypothetical protein BLOT_009042 [Blomia tropicalis]|nr:hypothetical protein BLOT_009042 [Blomia tropicalis]